MEFKTLKLRDTQLKFASSGKPTFTGYASVFGVKDDVGDIVHKGAFSDFLARHGGTVKMHFNHDWLRGNLPIGKMEVFEDDVGLFVKGAEFTEGIKLAGEVASALRHGTVDGLSVAIRAGAEGIKVRNDGIDWLKVADLREISIVNEPANPEARVASVKAALAEVENLKDIEAILREAGFSRADACGLVSRVKALAHGERDAERKQMDELAAFARQALFLPS